MTPQSIRGNIRSYRCSPRFQTSEGDTLRYERLKVIEAAEQADDLERRLQIIKEVEARQMAKEDVTPAPPSAQ